LKHFPSSQERQTLATRSAKEAPHKMHFVVVILRHLQPSLFFNRVCSGRTAVRPCYMADTVVCLYYMADTRVCPYYSPLAIRYSLPFRQSPVANHQSPFTAVLTSRQSLIASRCYHPCDFFSPLRIQPSQQPTGLIG
jgi:hypothetical protein